MLGNASLLASSSFAALSISSSSFLNSLSPLAMDSLGAWPSSRVPTAHTVRRKHSPSSSSSCSPRVRSATWVDCRRTLRNRLGSSEVNVPG